MSNLITEGSENSIGVGGGGQVQFKIKMDPNPKLLPSGVTTALIGTGGDPFHSATFQNKVICNQVECLTGPQRLNIGVSAATTGITLSQDNKDTVLNGDLHVAEPGFPTTQTDTVGFTLPTLTGSTLWTLPSQDGTGGESLVSDGLANLSFNNKQPEFRINSTTAQQTILYQTWTKLTNWAAVEENYNMSWDGSNLTVLEDGLYLIGFSMSWTRGILPTSHTGSDGYGGIREVCITKNTPSGFVEPTTETYGKESINHDDYFVQFTIQSGTTLLNLSAGDTVQIWCRHSAVRSIFGALPPINLATPIDPVNSIRNEFWAKKVRKSPTPTGPTGFTTLITTYLGLESDGLLGPLFGNIGGSSSFINLGQLTPLTGPGDAGYDFVTALDTALGPLPNNAVALRITNSGATSNPVAPVFPLDVIIPAGVVTIKTMLPLLGIVQISSVAGFQLFDNGTPISTITSGPNIDIQLWTL